MRTQEQINEIVRLLLGFGVFGTVFGLAAGLALWQCILIPIYVSGFKLWVESLTILKYKRTEIITNDGVLGKGLWPAVFVLLAAAYGLPAIGILIPSTGFFVCKSSRLYQAILIKSN